MFPLRIYTALKLKYLIVIVQKSLFPLRIYTALKPQIRLRMIFCEIPVSIRKLLETILYYINIICTELHPQYAAVLLLTLENLWHPPAEFHIDALLHFSQTVPFLFLINNSLNLLI